MWIYGRVLFRGSSNLTISYFIILVVVLKCVFQEQSCGILEFIFSTPVGGRYATLPRESS